MGTIRHVVSRCGKCTSITRTHCFLYLFDISSGKDHVFIPQSYIVVLRKYIISYKKPVGGFNKKQKFSYKIYQISKYSNDYKNIFSYFFKNFSKHVVIRFSVCLIEIQRRCYGHVSTSFRSTTMSHY